MKKRALGRGLSALFGDEKSENKPKTRNIASNTKALIGDLTRNPINQGKFLMRKNFKN